MAGAKINTKSKGKDDKSKGNKSICSNNEDNDEHDFSLLRKPVLTSITGFAQARKIFDFATEELKSLLANECDLLYECKVCRNIFRSLANLISHKRVYCKEKFSSSVHSHFIQNTSVASEMLKIKKMEEAYQESLRATEVIPIENEDRVPITKDLTGIVEKLAKIKGRYNFDENQVTLQKIPNSSVAMFQSHSEENRFDNMQAQVQELDSIFSQDNAVLQRDGSFNVQSSSNADKNDDSDNVIQISDDEDDDAGVPKCKICDMQFSTQKTLKFHMKYKHLESRLVYPCPDCFEIFSTSWSVYRHLFKVHRKSAAQIRRLRESIQAKAFRMNNPPAFYEKRKMKPVTPQKISEEERLDQENQAWMDNMELDGEVPRCGGCGRSFERRAALAAHTHTCQERSRALAHTHTHARRPTDKKIEIQIRKDYNKGPSTISLMPKTDNQNKVVNEEIQTAPKVRPEKNPEPVEKIPEAVEKHPERMEKKPESPEKVSEPVEENVPTENKLVEATMDIIDDKSSDGVESSEKSAPAKAPSPVDKKPKMRLPFAHQIEKNNLATFKQRMLPDVDLEKLMCKKCDAKLGRIQDLHDHMAGHYKWLRYACKLCNYKNYDFEKLPEHVKTVHKLKGDSDFYFSTVKAIDGAEALELAEPEESDVTEESSESRRPSRCSSESSRLSDDSSSSSARELHGARKRKMYHNRGSGKRKKEGNDETDDIKENDVMDTSMNNVGESESPSNVKTFEENSSDIEDVEEKNAKRHTTEATPSVASRRPVRKKTKPKNADFEYDLSNLLKMEAQGYRDSLTVTTTKPTQTKKRVQQELQSSYDIINKDHVGALALLSKKAVDKAAAELKTSNFSAPIFNIQKEQRVSNIFARPMLLKTSRGEKMSPKKDNTEETKDSPSNKVPKIQNTSPNKDVVNENIASDNSTNKRLSDDTSSLKTGTIDNDKISSQKEQSTNTEPSKALKPKLNIPAVVPIKFRRQSLEVMNNPIINKNITEFSKAGMKTKILLIKPINRNKDGTSMNSPLKFQTIKLKEQRTSKEDKANDQIVVVKVPKVERPRSDSNSATKKLGSAPRPETAINNAPETKLVTEKTICPTATSNTEGAGISDDQIKPKSSKSAEETNVHYSSLIGRAKIEESAAKNLNKDGCNSELSSSSKEAPSINPVAMDTEQLSASVSDIANVSVPELTIKQSSIQELGQGVENICNKNETMYDVNELCSISKIAISEESLSSLSSEANVITNGVATSL